MIFFLYRIERLFKTACALNWPLDGCNCRCSWLGYPVTPRFILSLSKATQSLRKKQNLLCISAGLFHEEVLTNAEESAHVAAVTVNSSSYWLPVFVTTRQSWLESEVLIISPVAERNWQWSVITGLGRFWVRFTTGPDGN